MPLVRASGHGTSWARQLWQSLSSCPMAGTYSQMRRKVLQAERSILAGWHLRERLGAPDALALARTQQDASPEDCDLATPRNAGCDEDGVLPRSGGVADRKQREMELVQRS